MSGGDDPAAGTLHDAVEQTRERILALYDIDGARRVHGFDDITDFAARLCDAPVALVTVLDARTQFLIGRSGVDLEQMPREVSFCQHTIRERAMMEVRDAATDPRFAANELVTGPLHVRFYAGMPMETPEGELLGAVCVLDVEPRPGGLTAIQQQGLAMMAKLAMTRLDDRRVHRATTAVADDAARALADSEMRFKTLADTMPQMVWATLPDGFHDYYNARWYEFTGVPEGTTDGAGWLDLFHVADRQRTQAVWRHSLETGEPYNIEYRLRHVDGTYRWVLGRALPIRDPATGAITRWFGTCTDIHEQKLAFEEREVISQELSHRIKNIFAVIAGLVAFAARAKPAFKDVADDLRLRITALGRAHDFVRPHSASSRPEAKQDSLHGLLAELFEPYQQGDEPRIVTRGDDVSIDDRSATPLALLFHELATNATKYGALSAAGGVVEVTVERRDDTTRVSWVERGGPIAVAPARTGFGNQLIELSAVRQLGGTVARDWPASGLVVTIDVPNASFSRRPVPATPA